MLVQYVNSPDGKNYFEILSVGQRFLSADNFPRKVEQVLKKMDKVLDFDDFVQCVKNAGDVTYEMTTFLRLKMYLLKGKNQS